MEYIGQITQNKVSVIGHSMGGTIVILALAEENKLVQKWMDKAFLLGPALW